MQLKVSILGPLEIRDGDDAVVQVGGARLRTLMVRLALDAGRSVTVGALVDALWGEEPPDGAANALQSLVSRLRRALGDPDSVTATPGGYRLAVPPEAVDAHRFEALAREGHNAPNAAAAQRILREALALWRGPALADVADAPYATAPATRLDELRLTALCDRLDADLRLGLHAEALPELEALATEHPLRENIAALLVKALYAAGRQADALAAYERVRAALADQLGIDPSKELADVHLAVLRSDPTLAPPKAAAASARRTNLRTRLTSFVGREEEVTRIGKLLETSRLVTLVGPGGAGKTRLASEAATRLLEQTRDLTEQTADGAWLAELAPVTDPAEVAQAVLSALGPRETRVLREQQSAPARDALSRATEIVADKHLVLVLDNCEHLIDAAASVAEHLLEHAPGLRVVATSREPLGILGETVFPVHSLAQPTSETEPAEALAFPAIRLFADRAAAVRPDFAVGAGTIADVVQICRRLDGLPLAIELAAARLRTLPLHLVASRLDDRFRLLTGGSRTAMPRHQTLRAVVAWSWELLSAEERDLAERLSVFPGGITAESAASVHPATPDEIYDLLSALVDKSLLQTVATEGDAAPRYRMLETLREYGTERLAEAGTVTEVRRAQARYFRDLAEEAEPNLRRREQLASLAKLNADYDNILAALRFAADDGDADTAVRMAAALSWYWTLSGRTTASRGWLELALAVEGDSPPDARAIASVLHILTGLFTTREWDEIETVSERLVATLADVDTVSGHPLLAVAEATIPLLGDDADAMKALVLRLENHPDPWVGAMLRFMRGMAAENDGDLATQRADLEEARTRFTAIGDRWGLAAVLSALAEAALADGDSRTALALQDETLTLMREINAADDAAQVQMMRANAYADLGRFDEARALMDEVLEAALHSGSEVTVFMAHYGLAELARRLGDLDEAWSQLRTSEESVTPANWAGPPQVLTMREVAAAMLHLDSGDPEGARLRLAEAVSGGLVSRDMPVLSRVAVSVARYAAVTGDGATGARVLGIAAGLRGAVDRGDIDRKALASSLRASLGDAEFESCHEAGRTTTREESVALLARVVGVGDGELGDPVPDRAAAANRPAVPRTV